MRRSPASPDNSPTSPDNCNPRSARVTQLQQQLDWFKRQLFGRTSEKRLEFDEVEQANLFAALGIEAPPEQDIPTQEITYRRREKRRDGAVNECGLRFDETVPVEVIQVADPAVEAIPEAEREVIGEKVSHRLAQEPGSYKILKYVRQVVKRRDTGELLTPPAPANVLERTVVDVSFLAGMLIDKFPISLAALPPASTSGRQRHPGKPEQSDELGGSGRRPAGAGVCGAGRAYPARRRCRHGRDIRESRPRGAGEDAHRLFLAGVRGGGRDCLPLRPESGAQACGGVSRGL